MPQRPSRRPTGKRVPRLSPQGPGGLPLEENSDDFVFDNETLAQAVYFGFRIGEISCPTKYFADASSISFRRSVTYGFGVLSTAARYTLQKWGLRKDRIFAQDGRRLSLPPSGH